MTPEEGGRKKPCTADMQLMVFSKTWDCAAFVSLVGKDMAMPGEDASMNLRLMKPMVLEEGQQFTIRDSTGTIGTGNFGFTLYIYSTAECLRSLVNYYIGSHCIQIDKACWTYSTYLFLFVPTYTKIILPT